MRIRRLHRWDLTAAEARSLQEKLARQVRLAPLPPGLRHVAGADVALSRCAGACFAAVVVFAMPEMAMVETVVAAAPLSFPYVPGLLTFREGPALLKAFEKLRVTPDAVIFDGQGLAHPRRLGLASHMGLWLGLPSVGCAKSRLIGRHGEVGAARGSRTPLVDGEEQIGVVLRTRDRVRPLYVSPGHLADFDSSAELVISCCSKYRLPEPTRQAHIAVSQARNGS